MAVRACQFVLKPKLPVIVEAYFVRCEDDCTSFYPPVIFGDGETAVWVVIEGDEAVVYSVDDFSDKYCTEPEYIQGTWK